MGKVLIDEKVKIFPMYDETNNYFIESLKFVLFKFVLVRLLIGNIYVIILAHVVKLIR